MLRPALKRFTQGGATEAKGIHGQALDRQARGLGVGGTFAAFSGLSGRRRLAVLVGEGSTHREIVEAPWLVHETPRFDVNPRLLAGGSGELWNHLLPEGECTSLARGMPEAFATRVVDNRGEAAQFTQNSVVAGLVEHVSTCAAVALRGLAMARGRRADSHSHTEAEGDGEFIIPKVSPNVGGVGTEPGTSLRSPLVGKPGGRGGEGLGAAAAKVGPPASLALRHAHTWQGGCLHGLGRRHSMGHAPCVKVDALSSQPR